MKVNIIGLGSSWKKAPMDGECWGVNTLNLKRPVTLMFNMHPIDLYLQYYTEEAQESINKANVDGTPTMVIKEDGRIKTGIVFPIDEMPSKYFTSSIAYMIAYALHKGATSLALYGIPLVSKVEYHEQRCCIEYWLGRAEALGVDVTLHGLTSLFTTGLKVGRYGYEWNQLYQKIP